MCYCPTPTLHLNLALTGDGAFLLSPQKTHSVWFISVLNYGDTENVLINHLLLVIPMSYPCHYTNLCPHKPHKHAETLQSLPIPRLEPQTFRLQVPLMDWSGVDYLWIIVMFLSAVWTLILTAPIHYRASIGEILLQRHISPNLMKKQTHLHLWCSEGEHIFS